MNIEILTKETFVSTIQAATKPVIVDFYADWCGPCKMIAPMLEELAIERDDVCFCKVNIQDEPEIAEQLAIRSIPMLMSFKDGKLYKSSVGVQPKQNILNLID